MGYNFTQLNIGLQFHIEECHKQMMEINSLAL